MIGAISRDTAEGLSSDCCSVSLWISFRDDATNIDCHCYQYTANVIAHEPYPHTSGIWLLTLVWWLEDFSLSEARKRVFTSAVLRPLFCRKDFLRSGGASRTFSSERNEVAWRISGSREPEGVWEEVSEEPCGWLFEIGGDFACCHDGMLFDSAFLLSSIIFISTETCGDWMYTTISVVQMVKA